MELRLKDRQKLTSVTAKKYRTARKKEKTRILDTFIEQTQYNRKYAIHILANEGRIKGAVKKARFKAAHKSKKKRVYPVKYGKAVQDALIPIWEAFNCQCGKLLAPFLHENIDGIAGEPAFASAKGVADKLNVAENRI